MRKIIEPYSICFFPENNEEVDSILSAWNPPEGIESELKKQLRKDPSFRIRIVVDRIDLVKR